MYMKLYWVFLSGIFLSVVLDKKKVWKFGPSCRKFAGGVVVCMLFFPGISSIKE